MGLGSGTVLDIDRIGDALDSLGQHSHRQVY
jgi:hypothetical protein